MEIEIPPEEDINEDGTLLFKEYTVSCNGKWRVHMNDADDWPSNFHAHNVGDGNEKLDLYTGEVYDVKTKDVVRHLKKKVMRYIFHCFENCGNPAIEAKCAQHRDRFGYLAQED